MVKYGDKRLDIGMELARNSWFSMVFIGFHCIFRVLRCFLRTSRQIVATVLTYPLIRAKVLQQTMPSYSDTAFPKARRTVRKSMQIDENGQKMGKKKAVFVCLREVMQAVLASEGFSGLYRGGVKTSKSS